ncbi:hypothetical protein GCM10023116_43400 [Kistimonas scapharcae]|uniref:Uncharacterized protein n=1 Tax=Kistimonas scapharcae TaxID=1036133 RepID=A0ABP8V9K6_9GAMM
MKDKPVISTKEAAELIRSGLSNKEIQRKCAISPARIRKALDTVTREMLAFRRTGVSWKEVAKKFNCNEITAKVRCSEYCYLEGVEMPRVGKVGRHFKRDVDLYENLKLPVNQLLMRAWV